MEQLTPDGITGFVPCAGLAGLTGVDPSLLVSVNCFGAVDVLTGLQPLLARRARGRPGSGPRPSGDQGRARHWARSEGVEPAWIGAGIRINAVAPD